MSFTDHLQPGRLSAGQVHQQRILALLIVLVSLAFFLPGFSTLQPMDRDEPRFAQATKQMLGSGDFVAIRFQTEARNKKPVGVYWMQASAVTVGEWLGVSEARTKIWLYRLPSLFGAIATVVFTWWAARALVCEGAALIAALFMASTILLGVEARLAKTDAVVTATVTVAMGVLARLWMTRGKELLSAARLWGLAAIFWAALGIGILVKGPITPMVPAFAALALGLYARSAGWLKGLKPIVGILLCVAIVSPWFYLIMEATQGEFLRDSLGADMMSKVQSGQEAHGAPPGTYLLAFFVTAWPMSPLAALAVPFAWKMRRDPAVAFLLAWIIPVWLLFELVPTKLPHYVLPAYPAIAILTAYALEKQALALNTRWRHILWLVPGIALVLVLVGLVGPVVLGAPAGALFYATTPFVLWQAWRMSIAIRRGEEGRLVPGGAVLAFFSFVMVYGGILTGPVFDTYSLSPRLAHARAQAEVATNCRSLAPATVGYREPSLVFLTRTDIVMADGAQAGAFLKDGTCRIAFVSSREEEAFKAALGETASKVQLQERVLGVNLNGGRKLDMGIYVRGGQP